MNNVDELLAAIMNRPRFMDSFVLGILIATMKMQPLSSGDAIAKEVVRILSIPPPPAD